MKFTDLLISWAKNKFFVALAVPVLFTVFGILAKKMVRKSWDRKDWFLGIEYSLGTLSSVLIYFFELLKDIDAPGTNDKFCMNLVFCLINLAGLFSVMSLHQDFEDATHRPVAQLIWLGVLANMIGFGLMFAFIIFVKGLS